MKRKYIDESWYIVFDGTSFYGVLGMDIEDTLQEDPDIEIVSGPYKEYPSINQKKNKHHETTTH